MLLRLKPYNTNSYKLGGILIVNPSPYYWLCELQRMNINVHNHKVFAIPSTKANELYGCMVMVNTTLNKIDLGKNNKLQIVENRLFIPENTILFPQLTTDDWERLFSKNFYFMHPQLGLIELDEEVNWNKIVNLPEQKIVTIQKPIDSIKIPSVIKSSRLLIPEDKWLENISQFESEKDMMENLPFDMKKVMSGNQKEIDKYLKFLDKHPELALKYAIPVDLLGTSRGKEWAKFHFRDNSWWNRFLEKIFSTNVGATNSNSNSATSTISNSGNTNFLKVFLFTILGILGIGLIINLFRNTSLSSNDNTIVDSTQHNSPFSFFSWILIFLVAMFVVYVVLRLITGYKNKSKEENSERNTFNITSNKTSNKTSSTSSQHTIIPSAINWETFNVNENQNERPQISFGTADMSVFARVACLVILVVILVYLFYPFVNRFGINLFSIVLITLFIRLLYTLIRTDKSMFTYEGKNKIDDFQNKLFNIFIIAFLIKLLFIVFSFTYLPFFSVIKSLIIFVILGLVLGVAILSFASGSSGDGGNVFLDSGRFNALTERYEKLANQYIQNGDYTRAAYIYLKLLKNPYKAGSTLLDGKQYQNAAYVFLKQCNNKNKAAECFEQGRLYPAAIELYKELEQDEKVGDLYSLIHDKKNAFVFYNKIIENYKGNNQYVKASLVYRNKMQDYSSAQNLLLNGWDNNMDSINCLNNYFANIKDLTFLEKEIAFVYKTRTTPANKNNFLKVIKHEYDKDEKLHETTRNIAYQIVAEEIKLNKSYINELKHFTKNDQNILKDIMKFRLFGK